MQSFGKRKNIGPANRIRDRTRKVQGDSVIVHGTISVELENGDHAECAYIYDTEKNELIQVVGEPHINAEEIDLLQVMVELRHLANGSDEE